MSSHYTAGSMPLAFTQEDFLVLNVSIFWFDVNDVCANCDKLHRLRTIIVCTIQYVNTLKNSTYRFRHLPTFVKFA